MAWKVNRSVARLPVKEFKSWDADATEKEWRKFVSDKDPKEWGAAEWRKYGQRFLVHDDEAKDKFEGYKLPVAQVSDGRPVINSRALVAAFQALRGARGGVDLPKDVKEDAERLAQSLRRRVEGREEKEQLRKAIREFLMREVIKGLTGED